MTVRRSGESPTGLEPLPVPAGVTSEELEPVLESPTAPGLVRIEAPMVGTFYRAPEPGAVAAAGRRRST